MYNGVIIVNKEKDFTSHDVVAKLRGIVKQKKIGHTGTLDPQAEGVLPVCLGNATKLCDILTDKRKEYVAELLLGVTTDTQDLTGKVLRKVSFGKDGGEENRSHPAGEPNCEETVNGEQSCKASECREIISEEKIREAIASFKGKSMQIPPMYSALKVNGKKLYELAREGKEVERTPRPIEIYELEILSVELPVVQIRVLCSKGTYIRTLCNDIGDKLGCGGCMKSLVRTRVESFSLENAHTLSQIEEIRDEGNLWKLIIPVDEVFGGLSKIRIKKEYAPVVENGNICAPEFLQERVDAKDGEHFLMYHSDGRFFGIYEFVEREAVLKPYKMFIPTDNAKEHKLYADYRKYH